MFAVFIFSNFLTIKANIFNVIFIFFFFWKFHAQSLPPEFFFSSSGSQPLLWRLIWIFSILFNLFQAKTKKKPGGHWHLPVTKSHCLVCSQSHLWPHFGPHVPKGHRRAHVSPPQPSSHWHRPGSIHFPFWHGGSQTAAEKKWKTWDLDSKKLCSDF